MPQQNVDKMAKDADELHRKLYPEQYGDPPLPPDPDPVSPPEPPAEPVTPPVTPLTDPAPPAEPPATPSEGTPPTAPPDTTTPPDVTTPAPPAPEPWEQRYNALKGKYDAEVPRLFDQIKVLQEQVNRPVPPPPTPAPAPAPAAALTIKEILSGDPALETALSAFQEDYPDVADLLVKLTERSSAVTSQKVNELVKNQELSVQAVQEFKAESLNQRFWDVVNRELPDWQTVRNDPDFAVWLNETDDYTGLSRATLAQDALQKFDATRVVKIYNGFKTQKNSVSPSSAVHPTPPNPSAAPGANLVAPPSGGRTSPPATTPNTEPPITSAYIQKFYSDAAMGKYKARQVEFDKIEGRINRAVSEGRVV